MTKDSVFAPQQWMAFWTKMGESQFERMQALGDQWAKLEGQSLSQWTNAFEEMNKLGRESVAYGGQLASEWRKLCFDAMKKSAASFTPPAA